jgi:cell division protein FtsQ
VLLVALGVASLASPWWGPLALLPLDFFHVRKVEVHGVRWLDPQVVVDRMRIDTTRSVWDDLGVWAARIRGHPQVQRVEISRRLPGTLVVTVTEVVPVALVPGKDGFRAFDSAGRPLPLDPSAMPVDAPLIPQRDTQVLALLGAVRAREPDLYARISEVRRGAPGELIVTMGTLPVRALAEVTPARLAEILLVARDLDRRGLRATELDLRFRDQVVARLP